MRPTINIIAAIDSQRGMGRFGKIPWSGQKWAAVDRRYFSDMTRVDGQNTVIMGRKTWESIGNALPGRTNIVVSQSIDAPADGSIIVVPSLAEAIKASPTLVMWVIGGAQLYAEALQHPLADILCLTIVPGKWYCDVKFPFYKSKTKLCSSTQGGELRFNVYKVQHDTREEQRFNDLMRTVIAAPPKPNRTGIIAHSICGATIRFSLMRGYQRIWPLLTAKRVYWQSVYHELMWFLRGCRSIDNTRFDTSYLVQNGVKIWDGNTTKAALATRGLVMYEEGETGPIYGAQWRDWRPSPKASDWQRTEDRFDGRGRDQLAMAIKMLRADPYDRRIVISAWNPAEIPYMALPPCHYAFQFVYDGKLNCVVTMRSGDLALGIPFNIASYSLLTHLVSQVTGLIAGELVINIADCHVYSNHLEGVKQWLAGAPTDMPQINFSTAVISNTALEIDDFHTKYTIQDIIVGDYWPYQSVKLDMAV